VKAYTSSFEMHLGLAVSTLKSWQEAAGEKKVENAGEEKARR
jgi:hypothetical protein